MDLQNHHLGHSSSSLQSISFSIALRVYGKTILVAPFSHMIGVFGYCSNIMIDNGSSISVDTATVRHDDLPKIY